MKHARGRSKKGASNKRKWVSRELEQNDTGRWKSNLSEEMKIWNTCPGTIGSTNNEAAGHCDQING